MKENKKIFGDVIDAKDTSINPEARAVMVAADPPSCEDLCHSSNETDKYELYACFFTHIYVKRFPI